MYNIDLGIPEGPLFTAGSARPFQEKMPMRFMNSSGKLTILLVVCATLLGAVGHALATEPGTYAKALAEAEAENKMVVIDFFTDW